MCPKLGWKNQKVCREPHIAVAYRPRTIHPSARESSAYLRSNKYMYAAYVWLFPLIAEFSDHLLRGWPYHFRRALYNVHSWQAWTIWRCLFFARKICTLLTCTKGSFAAKTHTGNACNMKKQCLDELWHSRRRTHRGWHHVMLFSMSWRASGRCHHGMSSRPIFRACTDFFCLPVSAMWIGGSTNWEHHKQVHKCSAKCQWTDCIFSWSHLKCYGALGTSANDNDPSYGSRMPSL